MTREVNVGARPRILLHAFCEAGVHGVPLHITKGGRQVSRIEGAGIEAILPEVAGAAAPRIEISGVAAMGSAERNSKRIRLIRDRDQMNMIRHQAISEDAEVRLAGRGAEPIEIDLAIGVSEEDRLAVGSALGNVMGKTDGDGSGKSWHLRR